MLPLTLGKMFTGGGWLNNSIAKVIKSSTIIRNLAVFYNYIFEIEAGWARGAGRKAKGAQSSKLKGKGDKVKPICCMVLGNGERKRRKKGKMRRARDKRHTAKGGRNKKNGYRVQGFRCRDEG
jgi:hypothetical protein